MNILPGEPVPPGFEDEVNRGVEIQKALDEYSAKPLIGIEYTVEMRENDRHEPGYLCTLCDKRGDPRTIMAHLTSHNHRMKYLEKHYPSSVRELNPIRLRPNSQLIVSQIVQSITKAIEEHHGRLRMSVHNADDFRRNRAKIVQDIANKYHYDERNGPNFLNAIDRSLWERVTPSSTAQQTAKSATGTQPTLLVTLKNTKCNKADDKEQGDLDEISSDSDHDGPANGNKKVKLNHVIDKKLPTPRELSLQASHIAQERYKWEKYRCMLEIQLKQMTKQQKDFEINPEKHPLYPEEWKKFWNQRYKELQAEGKVDPNKYDYKPEWIVFWTKRMKKIHEAEVEKKKKELKTSLGLPENAEEKVEQLKERYKVQVAPPKRNEAVDVINISDGDDSPKRGGIRQRRISSSRSRSRSRSRVRRSYSSSPSPLRERGFARRVARSKSPHSRYREMELDPASDYYQRHARVPLHHVHGSEYMGAHARFHHGYNGSYRVLDSHKIPKYSESPGSSSNKNKAASEAPEEEEGPLTVVSVLRLVIALEDNLGSLGHKVVDMLGKALALEKVKANSADDLLLNEDHVVFFETIKEKLRGLLIADVIEDMQKQRAVKKAIMNIAKIIHQVTNSAKGKAVLSNDNDSNGKNGGNSNGGKSRNSNANDLPFDRQLVASKLAAALVVHGREDITSEQMDRLIHMFLLMVKLNKARMESEGKSLRMREVAKELGLPTKPETAPKKPEDIFDYTDFSAHSSSNHNNNNDNDNNENNARSDNKDGDRSKANDDDNLDNADDDDNSSILESLSDPDLQTLLNNFKHLSTKEQHHLIVHLKRLERTDPQRVEKLRKYVNLNDIANESATMDSNNSNADDVINIDNNGSGSKRNLEDSPPGTSNYRRTGYSDDEDKNDNGIGTRRINKNDNDEDDDDDDDYNFDEVFKAASRNVNRLSEDRTSTVSSTKKSTKEPLVIPVAAAAASTKETSSSSTSKSALTFNPAGFNVNLKDTQNLIANLMGSIQQSNAAAKTAAVAAPAPVVAPPRNVAPVVQTIQQHQHPQQHHGHRQPINANMAVQQPHIANVMQHQQQHHHQQQQHAHANMPFFQHHQQQPQPQAQQAAPYPAGYDANMAANAGYYNQAHMGYGNQAQAFGQQWAQPQWQNYGMPGQQPPQQQPTPQAPAAYNMYGHRGN